MVVNLLTLVIIPVLYSLIEGKIGIILFAIVLYNDINLLVVEVSWLLS